MAATTGAGERLRRFKVVPFPVEVGRFRPAPLNGRMLEARYNSIFGGQESNSVAGSEREKRNPGLRCAAHPACAGAASQLKPTIRLHCQSNHPPQPGR